MTIDWNWIEDACNNIAENYIDKNKIIGISGIPRGGIIPAVILSHKCKITLIPFEELVLIPENLRKYIVVIDDIVDTGITMSNIDIKFKKVSLIYVNNPNIILNYTYFKKQLDGWVIFPWERYDSDKIQDYLKK